MSWEPKQRLWRKLHRGKRYTLSCKQLSGWYGKPVPETKDGSYLVANLWWESKRAEVDGQVHPHAEYLDDLSRRRDWARSHGDGVNAEFLWWESSRIEAGGEPCEFGRNYASFTESVKDKGSSGVSGR